MFNPMLILALVLAFVLNGFFWFAKGVKSEDVRWTAKVTTERLAATEAARKQEQNWQGVVNATSKAYLEKIGDGRRKLDVALGSLRNRPERPGNLPDGPRPDCQGATGAELSRADGEFLAREAARADDLRAGLEACYTYADTVTGK